MSESTNILDDGVWAIVELLGFWTHETQAYRDYGPACRNVKIVEAEE